MCLFSLKTNSSKFWATQGLRGVLPLLIWGLAQPVLAQDGDEDHHMGQKGSPQPVLAHVPSPVLDYSLTYATNYVNRGESMYVSSNARRKSQEQAFTMSPAVQPGLVFYGPNHISFAVGGVFATQDRSPNADTNFEGLAKYDEIDYRLHFDWENQIGKFYTGLEWASFVGQNVPGVLEMVFSWRFEFWKGANPSFVHYEDVHSPYRYNTFSLNGGEDVPWSMLLGLAQEGISEITLGLGANLPGGVNVSVFAASRPKPTMHRAWDGQPYNKDGTYTDPKGNVAPYPNVIYWATITWGGSIAEEKKTLE